MANTDVKENGVAVITPTDEVVKSLAEKGITQTLITELAKHKDLTVDVKIESGNVIYNQEQFKAVSEARKKIKSTRVLIEKTCKSFRDVHTAINKEYSAKEKEFVSLIEPVEALLLNEETKVEQAKEKVRQEEAEKEERLFKARVLELEALGMQSKEFGAKYTLDELSVQSVDLRYMPEGGYQSFLSEVKAENEKIKEATRLALEKAKAEAAEFQKQKEAQEAEAKRLEEIRLEQERKEKLIAESQARIDAEKKRIADEKQAAEQAKIREQELVKAREEAAAKAIQDEKEKVERERIAAEAKAKQEAFDKAEAERKAKEKEERRIARMPDKKKLAEFINKIPANTPLDLKTIEGKNIHELADQLLNEVIEKLNKEIETL